MKEEDDNETMVASDVKDTNKRQRSTTLSSPNVVPAKKMKVIHDDEIDDEQITTTTTTEGQQLPNYLSITNRFFIAMARNILKTNSTITMHDIQQLALFIHQKAVIHSRRELIKVYLLSIMGKLQQTDYDSMDIDRRFWPVQVQSLLLNRRKSSSTTADTAAAATTTITTTTTSTIVTDMISTEEQLACHNTLQEQLREMKEEIERYQQLFDEKKNSLTKLTSTMEESIEAYVQNYGIRALKLKHDLKMTLVKHDYDAEILRRKYMHAQPNEYQVRLLKI